MSARQKPKPLLPHEELAAQQPLAKPQYRDKPEPADTRDLKFRKIHPLRDRGYLTWLGTKRCSIYGMTNQRTGIPHVCWSPELFRMSPKSDPAHTGKAYSGKLKRADSGAFPLCRHAHREQEPNMDRFDSDYGIDRHEIAAEFYDEYTKLKR